LQVNIILCCWVAKYSVITLVFYVEFSVRYLATANTLPIFCSLAVMFFVCKVYFCQITLYQFSVIRNSTIRLNWYSVWCIGNALCNIETSAQARVLIFQLTDMYFPHLH